MLGLAGTVWAISALILYFIDETAKRAIREQTTAVWMRFAETDPLIVVRAPLTFVDSVLNALYGIKLFSWRGLWRSFVASTSLLFAALLLTGLFVHKPLGLDSPSQTLSETFDAVSQIPKNPASFQHLTPDQQASTRRLISTILSYNTSQYKLLYGVMIVVLTVALNWLIAFVCLAICRRLIREMIGARSVVSLFALHTLNFILMVVVCTTCLSVILIAATPFAWAILALLVLIFAVSKFVGMSLIVPALWCAIWFSPVWIRVVAVIATLPSVLLFVFTIIALLLNPWRVQIHRSVLFVLDKFALREKAVVAMAVALCIAVISIVAGVFNFSPR